MTDREPCIRVKAMLVAVSPDGNEHAVSVCPPSVENPWGYHRFVGGSVEVGETHRQAVQREVREELGASIKELTHLGVVESFFTVDGVQGHEIVFLYAGRLDPPPPATGGVLTESDGTVLDVCWRPFADQAQALPLYPEAAAGLLSRVGPGAWPRDLGRQDPGDD